jgi:hypothetical protein
MQHPCRLITLGIILAAIGGGAALAQPAMRGPGPGGMGPGMMGRGPGPWSQGTDAASYLDRLKADLGITAEQEPAWKAYAETVQGAASQMQGTHQTMYAAAEKLLPSLTEAQQTKAACALPGLAARGPGMMGHWAR